MIGRFLCPDPLKDKRGDGDLYDYCVDNPVGAKDSNGLFWGLVARKTLGNIVTDPDIANGPEIEHEVRELEDKVRNGNATPEDRKRLWHQQHFLEEWEDLMELQRVQKGPRDPRSIRR